MKILDWFIRTRNRKIATAVAFVVVAIPALWLAWWLASPLFIDREVNEEFPYSASAEVPDGLSQEEVEAAMAAMAKITYTAMSEPMSDDTKAASEVALTGNFRNADSFHKGSGTATIYKLAGGAHILRLEDFRVTNGPDLRVLLSGAADPMSRSEFNQHEYVEVAPLKGNVGNQNYEITTGLDVSEYRSVIIYCKPFRVLFSVAPLSPPG